MKRSFLILIISGLCSFSFPEKAESLPFSKNCSSMQSYFNSSKWKVQTIFTGFENDSIESNESTNYVGISLEYMKELRNEYERRGGDISNKGISQIPYAYTCTGFVKEISPMGTRVCKGKIFYKDPFLVYHARGYIDYKNKTIYKEFKDAELRWDIVGNEKTSCKWQ